MISTFFFNIAVFILIKETSKQFNRSHFEFDFLFSKKASNENKSKTVVNSFFSNLYLAKHSRAIQFDHKLQLKGFKCNFPHAVLFHSGFERNSSKSFWKKTTIGMERRVVKIFAILFAYVELKRRVLVSEWMWKYVLCHLSVLVGKLDDENF